MIDMTALKYSNINLILTIHTVNLYPGHAFPDINSLTGMLFNPHILHHTSYENKQDSSDYFLEGNFPTAIPVEPTPPQYHQTVVISCSYICKH